MRYYIADCHFFHQALLDHMDCRGFESVEEMNEYMIAKWNERVRKNDEVVVLGDLSWGTASQTRELLARLKGKIFLIRGNHDLFLKDKGFDDSRFGWVKDYAELSDNRRKVVLSHYPIVCYNGQYRRDENGNPKTYMLHGHIHNTRDQKFLDDYRTYMQAQSHENIGTGRLEPVPFEVINCFCQYSDYTPLTLDEWIENDRHRRLKKEKADELADPA
ncbi:MAG: metallophosphoesterase [Erysipelotrichaceae bacterium]|nr:metallophosphoesterase [Erysipelotrichaceae bacterium]